ncbi:4-phosphopantetheinyl transferase [Paraflavitalea soli]|uniref:4-phosphopantetheinyl transferase n=1 Tax=Paraflavitalea soli TaxID=2315862 RepID=A0A3B7MKQ0_9BACT|nr:4'-phosphopantetheinyl transferase superfamily protein [Paraflavitalea soli]AXY75052.1 4-phosphopantetheinyl transferase [Paraflavitalea soli]
MALFYQHNINEHTKVGIWRIEEPESFFLEKVPLKRDVSHPYKRLQHLAGRYLLPALYEDFPLSEILVADTRKPFLENERYHFSISHCGNFAAAIVSDTYRVGVDIELVTPRLRHIAGKFLHPEEALFLEDWEALPQMHLELTTLLWSAKEAIYKWHGEGMMDFKEHMRLSGAIKAGSNEWITMPFEFRKGAVIPMTVTARLFDQLGLAWVVT